MLKIGDFSKLSYVSIKALRLYDQKGLLKPAKIDTSSGYRYYAASQLSRLNRILALKDLGFSLEQIKTLLAEDVSLENLQGMLRLKQDELHRQLKQEQARLVRVEARLQQIQQEGTMPTYDVVLKPITPLRVASIRETLPDYFAVGRLYGELGEYLAHQGKAERPFMTVWHDEGYQESDVDSEATAILQGDETIAESDSHGTLRSDRVKLQTLPAYDQAACLIYQGSYLQMPAAYQFLIQWIEANQMEIIGPNREFYIEGGEEQDNDSYVTEIQFPVAKT